MTVQTTVEADHTIYLLIMSFFAEKGNYYVSHEWIQFIAAC